MQIDEELKGQLKSHFEKIETPIVLRMSGEPHSRKDQLVQFLQDISSTCDRIELVEVDDENISPLSFAIEVDGQDSGVSFRGIPGGHEFSTLVLAILNASGLGKLPDQMTTQRIEALKGPIKLVSYVSLSCEVCPDVMQALNQMAILHSDFEHQVVDGGAFPAEVTALGLQGVPAVFNGNDLLHSGRISFGDLLQKLSDTFGAEVLAKKTYEPFDIAVVGGGPAGVSAAIYSARKGLSVALLSENIGGQVLETQSIENLIAGDMISGKALAADLYRRLEANQVNILSERRVDRLEVDGDWRVLHLNSGEEIRSRSVLIATGARWRELGIPGESEYLGRGVAFCPHCDGPYFKDKDIAVVGGGNSGVEAAIDLANIAKSVVVLEFLEELKADQVLVDRLNSLSNTRFLTNVASKSIVGDGDKVTGLEYQDRTSNELHTIELDGVFVQIGLLPNSQFVKDTLDCNDFGEIKVDSKGRTSLQRVYAAGDVTNRPYKQIITAMGDGASAALASFEDEIRREGTV